MSTGRELNAAIGGVFMTLKGAGQIVTQIIKANERPSDDLMARLALVAAGIEYGKDTLQSLLSPAPTAAAEPNMADTPEQAAWYALVGPPKRPAWLEDLPSQPESPDQASLLGQSLES